MLTENYEAVMDRVIKACKRSGRDPESVRLIPVSKTKPNEMIMELYDHGVRALGENYVQELSDKINSMPADIEWHMIGHLQRNKVKYIVGKVAMIHSVDSVRLAEEINKRSLERGVVTEILAEVNIAREENKFGFKTDEVCDFARAVSSMEGIRLTGLMTSAPYVSDPEENRGYFAKMHDLYVDIGKKNIDNVRMNNLSMGMTNDYEVAIEEGATIIRIGTAIFGDRHYGAKQ